MKVLCKIAMIIGYILITINGIKAQTMETKLNQVELLKQFIGTWKSDFGEGTVFIGNNKPFGNGLVCTSQIINNGKIIDSVSQLFGYDKKADKFIMAELIESSPVIELCSIWFTSEKEGEIIVTNPENAPLKYRFEFKTPDLLVQHAFQDGNVVREITLSREKY